MIAAQRRGDRWSVELRGENARHAILLNADDAESAVALAAPVLRRWDRDWRRAKRQAA